ncbi:hypothetical protein VMCG_04737 [Cytospora schulzeri]|uniref:Phosphatidylinositol transfer protein SFH5 n=1 Tax=Cytospora schulzeri TaxID=448051 RepID=A0A423WN30_9PEZI|nr:hypothetical protein VMCG_04737 [Valsa malicola]
MEAPNLDASESTEENVDALAETAQAETNKGEVPAAATTNPAPAQATAAEDSSQSATTGPIKDTPTTDASTAAPVATETKAGEVKSAEETGEAKTGEKIKPTPKEATAKKTVFDEFGSKLQGILKEVEHDEMWGVTLVTPVATHVPTQIVLQKFLNANDGELAKAVEQFKGALKFRKEKKPLELAKRTFNAKKFADLGAVTVYPVKGSRLTDTGRFMDYRIALQELGIQQLKLSDATEPITVENDPYKIMQVHDYKSNSFLRQPPSVKTASTEVIKQFALAYPELLKARARHYPAPRTKQLPPNTEKFFVNVPAIMGWMYALIKVFIAEKTAKKFHPMANGANLAAEFKQSSMDEKQLPKEYGGEGGKGDGKMKDIPGLVNVLKFV